MSREPYREWRVRDVQQLLTPSAPRWVRHPEKWAENQASRGLANLDRQNAMMQVRRGTYKVVNLENTILPAVVALGESLGRAWIRSVEGDLTKDPEVRSLSAVAQARVEAERRIAHQAVGEAIPHFVESILRRIPEHQRPQGAQIGSALKSRSLRLEMILLEVLAETWRNPPVRRA